MSIIRAAVYVAGLVLVHTAITLVIGAVLLLGFAGLHFLAEALS
jgi:hypothetical protein